MSGMNGSIQQNKMPQKIIPLKLYKSVSLLPLTVSSAIHSVVELDKRPFYLGTICTAITTGCCTHGKI